MSHNRQGAATLYSSSTGIPGARRQPSSSLPGQESSATLAARVASKRSELEDLKQLSSVSHGLASQLEALEEKLLTLQDGAKAVACIMGNWDGVFRALRMASNKTIVPKKDEKTSSSNLESSSSSSNNQGSLPLPLVRIETHKTSTIADS